MKVKSLPLIIAGVMMLFFVVKLTLPYQMPEPKPISPPAFDPDTAKGAQQWIRTLLANNLWDPERGALVMPDEANGGGDGSNNGVGNSKAEENTVWQLVGVSQSGDRQIAVITNGAEIKNLKPGDKLPDGAELIKILPYGIQTTRSGKNESFYLFGKK